MQVVKVISTGDWGKAKRWLNKVRHVDFDAVLHKYGEIGVRELRLNTPKRSGLTADSWTYKIEKDLNSSGDGIVRIIYSNGNLAKNWFSVALGLQKGHATGTGGWVEGRNYIDPALDPVFESIASNVWKEVTSW